MKDALRFLRARPAVTAIAVVSLAIGLAAAAASTSLLDAFGLRPLAVADPGALVDLATSQRNQAFGQVSYLDFEDVRSRARTLAGAAAYMVKGAGLSGPDAPPEIVIMNVVSPDYFGVLGVRPALGRAFTAGDATSGAAPAAVISDRLWRRRFGAPADVQQRTVTVNGATCPVIGVAPASFAGLDAHLSPDLWMLYPAWASVMSGGRLRPPSRGDRQFRVFARLAQSPAAWDRLRALFGTRPPVMGRAQAELDVIAASLASAYPDTNPGQHIRVAGEEDVRHQKVATIAVLLWIVVGLVLLVGCANVAGLLLGRAESRRQEMAIRVALGASRRRLVAQMLTEGLALSLAAGACGALLAVWIIHSLPALLPPISIPLGFEFRLDVRVLLVTFGVAAATTVVFGLGPALAGSRIAIAQAARGGPRDSRLRWWSARNVLVVGQIAVAFVLLVCGALLVRSLGRAEAIDPGFTLRPLLLASIAPPAAGYDGPHTLVFFRDLTDRLAATPGISRVGLAQRIPLDPDGGGAVREIEPPDGKAPPGGAPLTVHYNSVSANYFGMMGSRIVGGRAFGDREAAGSARVVIVNQTMAARFWPDGSAVGRLIQVKGSNAGQYEVVGVVEDGKYNSLAETPFPYMFFALPQVPAYELTMIVEAGPDPGAAAGPVREAIKQIDPRMPVQQMLTLAQHMRYALYEPRTTSVIVGVLGAAGLGLSVIGLYGVIAFVVARRTKEIGLRMAIGASPAQILRAVWLRALALTAAGVALGAVLGLAAAGGLAGSLYGVSPADPISFGTTALLLLVVAMAASWRPAHRAMSVDPVRALRSE